MQFRYKYLGVCLLFFITGFSQVGIGVTTPNAALDITSGTDGLLIPRVALTNTLIATVITPTISELVYNTATINDVTPGYYYWDGLKWVKLAVGSNNDWSITGNAGTVAATNYIGTSDPVDFRIRTAGANRWNISNANSGQLQSYSLGSAALPVYSFQGDPNTGVYSAAADVLSLSTGGFERFRIPAANQVHAMSLGTAALPFYTFNADPNTGIFSPIADNLAIATNGTEKARVTTNGQLAVGTTLPQGALDVTSTTNGILIPRVALISRTAPGPVVNPQGGPLATGTMVYNTATAGIAPNNVTPGYYYWRNRWLRKTDMIINTYIYPPINVAPGVTYTLTGTLADGEAYDAATVSIPGDWAIFPDIYIDLVETRTGSVRFRVTNYSFTTTYLGMDFAITTFKY